MVLKCLCPAGSCKVCLTSRYLVRTLSLLPFFTSSSFQEQQQYSSTGEAEGDAWQGLGQPGILPQIYIYIFASNIYIYILGLWLISQVFFLNYFLMCVCVCIQVWRSEVDKSWDLIFSLYYVGPGVLGAPTPRATSTAPNSPVSTLSLNKYKLVLNTSSWLALVSHNRNQCCPWRGRLGDPRRQGLVVVTTLLSDGDQRANPSH